MSPAEPLKVSLANKLICNALRCRAAGVNAGGSQRAGATGTFDCRVRSTPENGQNPPSAALPETESARLPFELIQYTVRINSTFNQQRSVWRILLKAIRWIPSAAISIPSPAPVP
jgi:hypothetical protein